MRPAKLDPASSNLYVKNTPVTVLEAGTDTIFSTAEIEKTAKAYGKKAKIFENMAHDIMLDDGWETVADYVIGAHP